MTMTGATAGLRSAAAGPVNGLRLASLRRTLASIAHHLDHQPLRAAAVELAVEDRLPRSEIQLPVGDRQDDLVVHQQVLEVRVSVVLASAVMPVVAGIG